VRGAPSDRWVKHPTPVHDETLEIWMTAFDIAAEDDVSPWDALLIAVRRRAARVRAVDRIIDAAWTDHRQLCEADPNYGNPEVPNEQVRVWMAESRNEERLMARTAKMAIDAGVAEAVVRHMEVAGRRAVDALVAGLDSLELTSEQRIRALEAAHLELMPGETPAAPGEEAA